MLIDLLTYFRLDKAALISALGFSKTVKNLRLQLFAGFLATAWHAGGKRFESAQLNWVFRDLRIIFNTISAKSSAN